MIKNTKIMSKYKKKHFTLKEINEIVEIVKSKIKKMVY